MTEILGMSKRSEFPTCDELDGSSLDLSDGSSASDMESDNSRDVNLNSKKFTDCNLFGAELEKTNDDDTTVIQDGDDSGENENDRLEAREGMPVLNPENPPAVEKTIPEAEAGQASFQPTSISTPNPAESQPFCELFPVSGDDSVESKAQALTAAKTVLNQSTTLSSEEIVKRFQDLSFAFKTDSMTIEKRLQLLKRRRDQAESNIENELKMIKGKLRTLQYLGLNNEYMNLMTELKKQLDFVLNATIQLSDSAEGYGYARHEERLLDLVSVMLQHVENLENSKGDSSKASENLKAENKRSSASLFLDNGGDDERLLRRRSVALEGNSRRRASIATLPRIGYSMLDSGNNGRGFQWTPNRPGGSTAQKKLPFSQTTPRTHHNGLAGIDDLRRDSSGSRQRKERRMSESSMKNIDESPEPQQASNEPELIEEPIDSNGNIDVSDSSLHLKRLFDSIQEIRRNSGAQEHITAVYCLRRILEWNKLLLSSTRFRWPQNVLHYVPFYITWYVVFVLAFVFIGGLFTGINGCYTYSCMKYSTLWLVAPAFYSIVRRFYRSLLLLFLTAVFALVLLFLLLFLLIKTLLPQLTNNETDSLLRTLGLEIRYLNGPPPI